MYGDGAVYAREAWGNPGTAVFVSKVSSRGRRQELRSAADIREFLIGEYPRLVNALGLLYGSREAAEDAVQEALARAWERSERGLQIGSPPAWVAAVA